MPETPTAIFHRQILALPLVSVKHQKPPVVWPYLFQCVCSLLHVIQDKRKQMKFLKCPAPGKKFSVFINLNLVIWSWTISLIRISKTATLRTASACQWILPVVGQAAVMQLTAESTVFFPAAGLFGLPFPWYDQKRPFSARCYWESSLYLSPTRVGTVAKCCWRSTQKPCKELWQMREIGWVRACAHGIQRPLKVGENDERSSNY